MMNDDGRVPSEAGCEASPSAADGVFEESHPSRGFRLNPFADAILGRSLFEMEPDDWFLRDDR